MTSERDRLAVAVSPATRIAGGRVPAVASDIKSPSQPERVAGPFLKWAGGKGKLAPLVVERAPSGIGRYHEPFVGGGAVFFAVFGAGSLGAGGAVLNDANGELMECYRVVRDEVEQLIEALAELAQGYLGLGHDERRAFYYARRAEAPSLPVERAARLMFLNRTCYNGLYRVNSQGRFNVPHGRYANPRILDEEGW